LVTATNQFDEEDDHECVRSHSLRTKILTEDLPPRAFSAAFFTHILAWFTKRRGEKSTSLGAVDEIASSAKQFWDPHGVGCVPGHRAEALLFSCLLYALRLIEEETV
jgi:hypothetical protein